MAKRRRTKQNRIPYWLWAGVILILATTVFFINLSLQCIQRMENTVYQIPATSFIDHFLVMVHPDREVLVGYTTSLRENSSIDCIVWEPDYRFGHSRTKLSCHVNPNGDIPAKLYEWALARRYHLIILSRPENILPDELLYLDEMMDMLYASTQTLHDLEKMQQKYKVFT